MGSGRRSKYLTRNGGPARQEELSEGSEEEQEGEEGEEEKISEISAREGAERERRMDGVFDASKWGRGTTKSSECTGRNKL